MKIKLYVLKASKAILYGLEKLRYFMLHLQKQPNGNSYSKIYPFNIYILKMLLLLVLLFTYILDTYVKSFVIKYYLHFAELR